ncbi:cyclic pyranopterin monophosphate synthase MoaC [Oscillatoria amoena NRMC-F 0135]|nr:cyclic pyranopterin monophosphate synthase MoaC [Oscillatoria amoena NRMC-F 0135]
MKVKKLTHTDNAGNPQMVDVSGKAVTKRTARAQAVVHVTQEITQQIKRQELLTKKGPVFQTAILAGTLGAKKNGRPDSPRPSIRPGRLQDHHYTQEGHTTD